MITIKQAEKAKLSDKEIDTLFEIITIAYAETEKEVWGDNYMRISKTEYVKHIDDGEILVAYMDGVVVGGVRHYRKNDDTYSFGLLGADFNKSGNGIGRALILEIEKLAHKAKMRQIEIEILRAIDYNVQSKNIISEWYQRMGYNLVGTKEVLEIDNNPSKWAQLHNPSVFDSYLKKL
jgi:GNAT superfamily N-acetyltransferase